MANMVKLLPELDARGLNVKIVCAASPQLFALQPEAYRQQVLSPADRADSTVITTQARWLMHDWLFNPVGRGVRAVRRLGRPLAHRRHAGRGAGRGAPLAGMALLAGIERFVRERPQRLARLRDAGGCERGIREASCPRNSRP